MYGLIKNMSVLSILLAITTIEGSPIGHDGSPATTDGKALTHHDSTPHFPRASVTSPVLKPLKVDSPKAKGKLDQAQRDEKKSPVSKLPDLVLGVSALNAEKETDKEGA